MQLGHDPGVVLTQGSTPVGQDPRTVSRWSSTTGRSPAIRVPTEQRSERRWHRSYGPGRLRRPSFGPTTSAGHRPPARRQQPDRDVMTDPIAALDRPHTPVPVGLDPVDVIGHRGEPGLIGVDPRHRRSRSRRPVITSIVADRLCGSIPITTRSACSPMHPPRCSIQHWSSSREGQRYFELGKPLLSLFPTLRCPAREWHERATRDPKVSVGSRNQSDEPGA